MSERQLSQNWGKKFNYLAEVKCYNREFYDYLKEHGLPYYKIQEGKVLADLADMYYYLTEARMFSTFFRDMLTDLYNSEISSQTGIKGVAFNNRKGELPYSKYLKSLEVIRRFELWKKNNVKSAVA